MSIFLNGLVKDYNPAGGIDAATNLHFDPTAQAWQASTAYAAPQGYASNDTWDSPTAHILSQPSDTGIPTSGPDKGLWVSGTAYSKYDKTTDPTDGKQYVSLVNNPTTTTQPHANTQWEPSTWVGFSVRSIDSGFYGAVTATGNPALWFSTELHALGQSGSSQPVIASGAAGLDGGVYWTRYTTYKGARANSTAYTSGDWVLFDGSIWNAATSGTSGASAPNVSSTNYGGSVFDGGVLWVRRFISQGAWVANTTYGFRPIQGRLPQQGGNDVYGDGVTLPDNSLLAITGIKGTDGTTGATEPPWSAAAAGTFWSDGTLIWRVGSFGAASGDGIAQNERLVLSGFKAPLTDGKQITVFNDAAAATARDVVLADKVGLDRTGTQNLPGTDKASIAGFDFGGTNIRLAEGQSTTVQYNAATSTWTQVGGGGGGGGGGSFDPAVMGGHYSR